MCLNFKTPLIKWFESDLLNKRVCISVGDIFSEAGLLNSDVPKAGLAVSKMPHMRQSHAIKRVLYYGVR